MTNPIINRTFKTPIGQVACQLTGDFSDIEKIGTKDYENGSSVSYGTSGHRIELIEFKIRQPLYNQRVDLENRKNSRFQRKTKIEFCLDRLL